jgi:hypothetical protein
MNSFWWMAKEIAGNLTGDQGTRLEGYAARAAAQPSTPILSGEVCPGMVAQPPASMNCRFA